MPVFALCRNSLIFKMNFINLYQTISYSSKLCPFEVRQKLFSNLSKNVGIFINQQMNASSSAKTKSLYDVLEVTPKATAGQIKKSYYKLSLDFHPDHYKGGESDEEGTKRFREINEAYEILGNISKRRLYDKGLYKYSIAASPNEASEFASKFSSSRTNNRATPTTGRTPIFDFDDWSKEHYSANFADKQQNIKMEKRRVREKNFIKHSSAVDAIICTVMFIVLFSTYTFR